MRSEHTIRNPSNPEDTPHILVIFLVVVVGIFGSGMHLALGVYFQDSKGFVFCTGTA